MRVRLTGAAGRPSRRREQGAVAALVAALLVPLLLVAAFSADVGMAYAQARAFGTGSDSGALAVVGSFRTTLQRDPSAFSATPGVASTCADLVARGRSSANASAVEHVRLNRPFDVTVPSASVATTLTCPNGPTGQLVATVTVTQAVPTTLGRLAGVPSITVSKTASAALGSAAAVGSFRPIAVCRAQADAVVAAGMADPSDPAAVLIRLDKVWGANGCSSDGSGNWGWLDCGDGVSTPVLAANLTNGCAPGSVDLSAGQVVVDGTPGNKGNANAVDTAMRGLVGTTLTLPVYREVTGNGANTAYTVQGFLQVRLCGYGGKSGVISSPECFDASPALRPGDDEMQVRYAGFLTPAELARQSCGIGAAGCGTALATALLQ